MTSPRALLTAWNIQAKKQLGQNFLNDPNVARAIVNKAGIGDDDVVLEIGPGLGAITVPAATAARRVIAADKDGRIIGLLRTELLAAGIDNVDVREADILRVDLVSVSREAGRPLVVLGNLPYNISSQVLVQLIHARSGVDRAVLAFLCEAYTEDQAPDDKGQMQTRTVMKFHPRLAPTKVAVFPLVKKEGMPELATEIHSACRAAGLASFYDEKGAVGRRYRRQDEAGTPYCVTVDGQTREDGTVTIRDRDSLDQTRIAKEDVVAWVQQRIA